MLALTFWALLISCSAPDYEGDELGECTDGTDNDSDGAFDCNDSDCIGTSDCLAAEAESEAWEKLVDHGQTAVDYESLSGVAFAVILDGKLAYADALGWAWDRSSAPLTTQSVLRWNSISKMHTATAVMQLVETGELSLDDEVVDWLPDVKAPAPYGKHALTVHNLMTHTSGLPDSWAYGCTEDLDDHWPGTTNSLMAEPGTLYNYSNSGWSLTGRILEVATGESYPDLMRERVLGPAGMDTATFVPSEISLVNSTIGYNSGTFYTPDLNDCPWLRPAAMLYGSVLDLAKMAELQLAGGGELLTATSLDEMRVQHPTYGSTESYTGYGQFSWTYRGIDLVGHGGSGAGYRSYFIMAPESGFAVVVAANDGDYSTYGFAMRAVELFLEMEEPTPEVFITASEEWTSYVGFYEDKLNVGTIEVFLDENEKLYAIFHDGTGISRRMYQRGRDEFIYADSSGSYNYIRFVPDDDGTTRYFANRYFVAERNDGEEDPDPAPRPPEEVAILETKGLQPHTVDEEPW